MPHHLPLRSISAACVLVLSGLQGGQAPPSIKQDAKNTTCSNIVALTRDVSINCSSLTPKQQEMIDSIPPLLRKLTANQLDFAAFMAKLDECLKGIPQHRRLTDQQKATLKSATALWPDGLIVVSHVGDPEAKEFSDDFKKALGTKVSTFMANVTEEDTSRGIQIRAPYNGSELRLYNYAQNLANAMKQDGFPDVEFVPNPVQPKITITPNGFLGGAVEIFVGFAPSTH